MESNGLNHRDLRAHRDQTVFKSHKARIAVIKLESGNGSLKLFRLIFTIFALPSVVSVLSVVKIPLVLFVYFVVIILPWPALSE